MNPPASVTPFLGQSRSAQRWPVELPGRGQQNCPVAASRAARVSEPGASPLPGGVLGEHEAPTPQLFVVVDGRGWAADDDGQRHEISVGHAVLWDQGERHESVTDSGMTVVVMQALELNIVAPPV